ncbi:MAG: 16S rRNA methyltransferase, partial [archaeon]|nr:16S rRNA methyltransferase [archaeon]
MTPLTIILAECGLELIPKTIRKYSSVQRNLSSKNYSSQLLDNALHHSAMKDLKDFEKRGRPDILHACILNALGSPLNKSGKLNLYIHTTNDKIFKFNPEIRIARNFNRFKGLVAKLLMESEIIADGTPLITQI